MHSVIDEPALWLDDLIGISLAMSLESDLTKQLSLIATTARRLACAQSVCIYLLDNTKCWLIPELVQGESFPHQPQVLPKVPLQVEGRANMDHIAAYCAKVGQVENIDDIYRRNYVFDFSNFYQIDRLTSHKTQSMLCLPLTDHAGTSIGVMLLINRCEEQAGEVSLFPVQIEHPLRAFAAHAAIAVHNRRLLQENKQLIEKMEKLNQQLIIENTSLKAMFTPLGNTDKVIGKSPAMKKVFNLVSKVANSTATILLRGETGTGKELIAEVIHGNSPVAQGPFIPLNCAALPADLLESELFGYKKGAFSGASNNKKGLFELADKGTIFLDEIGDMPFALQTKLLRVLQEGKLRPLGATQEVNVAVRVIAATHCPLEQLITQGKFREDLFYRLNVYPIHLPPLRERREDIPALVSFYIGHYQQAYGKQIRGISPAALEAINHYKFPGNIRELQNLIERSILLADDHGAIKLEHLPLAVQELGLGKDDHQALQDYDQDPTQLKAILARFEARVLKQKLDENQGNQTMTAQQLGVSRRTLVDKIAKYQLR